MKILKYFIISLFVLVCSSLLSQEKEAPAKDKKEAVKDEEPKEPRPIYFRLGVDPFSVVKSFIYPATVSGITFQIDAEIKEKYFPVIELGNENFSMDHPRYTMLTNGAFLRLGVDQNMVKYVDSRDRDIFFAGVRYCIGSGANNADNIVLPNAINQTPFSLETQAYFIQWGELVAGVKTELFSNVFLGWTARAKRRFSLNKMDIDPYYIPGYGKSEKNINVELSVQILYAIPYKKKQINGKHP